MNRKPLTFHDSNLHSTISLTSKRIPVCGSYRVLDVDMVLMLQKQSIEAGNLKHVTCGIHERAG